jgi:hypothetical protein
MSRSDFAKWRPPSKFLVLNTSSENRLEKKFKNALKAMQEKHNHSIVQLDHQYEKTISNRPRYQAESTIKPTIAEKSMRSVMLHSRKNLMSAKGGRRV